MPLGKGFTKNPIFVGAPEGTGDTVADFAAHEADTTIHFTEASIDHGSIAGLGDDDHTQYSLVDGTRAYTGNVTLTTGAAQIAMTESGATDQNIRMYNSAGGLKLRNQSDGNTSLYQTDSSGVNEDAILVATRNADVALHYNGTETLTTADRTATGVQTGATVLDKAGNMQPVGLAIWIDKESTASETLTSAHVGARVQISTTPHALTTPASSDTDWPIGGYCHLWCGSAAPASTIVAGAGVTLSWFTGAAITNGTPRTLASGAVVTLYRRSATAFHISGTGIT